MSRNRFAPAAIAAAAAVSVGTAPAYAAPTIATDHPCYTPGMEQHITGSGFTAAGEVSLDMFIGTESAMDYIGTVAATADAAGAIDVGARTPAFDQVDGMAAIIATDITLQSQGAPPEQVSTNVGLGATQWELTVARWGGLQARGKPGRRSNVTATGWVGTAGTTLYAHYLRGGRVLKTVRVGTLTGPCADLSGRMKEFPFRRVKAGTYRVQFDTTRAYPNDDASIFYRRVKVARAGSVRASAALADPVERLRTGTRLLEYR